jgi:alkanesulfonate monooxygenase SsuD/methylene tetrahydromethanopterin reductase-like flavin-dependent oxidoreductase (luciferase family)
VAIRVGVGLPNPVRGATGPQLIDWAQRAEAAGFAGLATIDRLAYPTHEPLLTLAAAAAVTTRIGLFTDILLGALRPPALLAKEALTLDQLSRGRFTLGLGTGGRQDDFEAAGVPFKRRGRRMDELLETLASAFAGEAAYGPRPFSPGGPPIMMGGTSDVAIQRAATHAVGWTSGGGGPQAAAAAAERVRAAWREAGREGSPRLAALAYFALGPHPEAQAKAYLEDYYAFIGPNAARLVLGAATSAQMVRDFVRAYDEIGFDELYLDPTTSDPDEVDRLAAAVLG